MLNEYLIGRVGEAKVVQAKLPGIKEDEVTNRHLMLFRFSLMPFGPCLGAACLGEADSCTR